MLGLLIGGVIVSLRIAHHECDMSEFVVFITYLAQVSWEMTALSFRSSDSSSYERNLALWASESIGVYLQIYQYKSGGHGTPYETSRRTFGCAR